MVCGELEVVEAVAVVDRDVAVVGFEIGDVVVHVGIRIGPVAVAVAGGAVVVGSAVVVVVFAAAAQWIVVVGVEAFVITMDRGK